MSAMLEDAIVSFQNLSMEEHKESELESTTELSQQAPRSLEEVEEMTGDSVLNLLVAILHYLDYPNLAPGGLTRLRSANVHTEVLARAALKYGSLDTTWEGVKQQIKDALWKETGGIEIYINSELIGRGKHKKKKTIATNRAADDANNNFFGGGEGGWDSSFLTTL
ncbi:hypothetical protein LXL04_030389 [Taraxacum kok-saghyz]